MSANSNKRVSRLLSSTGKMLVRLSEKLEGAPEIDKAELNLGRFAHLNQANTYDRAKNLSGSADAAGAMLQSWMRRLVQVITQFDLHPDAISGLGGEYLHVGAAKAKTLEMLQKLYSDFYDLGTVFNTVSKESDIRRVRVTVSDFNSGVSQVKAGVLWPSFRISTASRQLFVEAKHGKINFYMAPGAVALNSAESKAVERRKLTIKLSSLESVSIWTVYGLPIAKEDIRHLEKALFRDLVLLTAMDVVANESGNNLEHVDNLARLSDESFRDAVSLASEPSEDLVRDLILAQQNAVHKLLNQQEETQAAIARDLHDSVLADILMLRRRISSGESGSADEIVQVLDNLTDSIRDICSGLVPRDLKDWGLETVLQDLLDKVAERTDADCSFEVDGGIPDLPSAVQLHIFRIVQECLNNIEKYAEANSVRLELKQAKGTFEITIVDDGRGFDMSWQKEREADGIVSGGFGLPGISERVEIIKAFYPARYKIESAPGKGTRVWLQVTVASAE